MVVSITQKLSNATRRVFAFINFFLKRQFYGAFCILEIYV